jgi:chromosome segregation ATPase
MNEALIGLIAGVVGALATVIASRANRPTRTRSIVEASDLIIENLTGEIQRLDKEVTEARAEADGARTEARAARDAERYLKERVSKLEAVLRKFGIDPSLINGAHHGD